MCFSDVIKCKTEERNLLKQAAAVTLVGVLLEGIGIKKKPKALAVFGVTQLEMRICWALFLRSEVSASRVMKIKTSGAVLFRPIWRLE
jgi:hypothetical protein